jgi:predicted esterase
MPSASAQIATLNISPVGAHSGTPIPWTHGANLRSPFYAQLTITGTTADLALTGGATEPVPHRVGDHTMEARVPLASLPGGPWELSGGSGLADGAVYLDVPPGEATDTAPGSGGPTSPTNVWGLLSAGDDPWSFDELHQARQLTSGVDTSYTVVDPSLLRQKRTQLGPVRHGDISRLLHSTLPSKDGIRKDRGGVLGTPSITPPIPVPDFNVDYFYYGALQDYAMHVPTSYDGKTKTPLVVYLHGYTGLPEEPFRNPTGLVQAIDAKGWLLASALGRGDHFYQGGTPGDADVMEVIADVSKRYRVDADRIYLMGHSMGGYGTNNVGMHHPDVFAALAPAEGTGSPELHANLRNTPWFMMTAEEDLDFQAADAKSLYQSLSKDGYDATLLDYSLKTHEYSSIYDTLPRLIRFFDSHRRATRPAVVTFTRPVGHDNPALREKYDGAWWLRDLEPAPGVSLPTVTVESMALPHAAPGQGTATDEMVDEGGPTGRTGAELFQTVPDTTPAKVTPQLLKITGHGARSARVILPDAGLSTSSPLTVRSTTDHDLALVLTGATGQLQRTVDGAAAGIVTGSAVLPNGTHTVVLTPMATGKPRSNGGLAATGGLPLAGAGLLLAGGVLLGLRRRRGRGAAPA